MWRRGSRSFRLDSPLEQADIERLNLNSINALYFSSDDADHRLHRRHRRGPPPEREGRGTRRQLWWRELVTRRFYRHSAGRQPSHQDELVGRRGFPRSGVRPSTNVVEDDCPSLRAGKGTGHPAGEYRSGADLGSGRTSRAAADSTTSNDDHSSSGHSSTLN
jgi:hypothetical protein